MVSAGTPQASATRSGAKSRASARTSSNPPLLEKRVHHREQEMRVGARTNEHVLVGLLRRPAAARVDDDEPSAARPQTA